MLAENLVSPPTLCKPSYLCNAEANPSTSEKRVGESDNGMRYNFDIGQFYYYYTAFEF